MKLDSILLGTTIDQITSSQALNLATLLSWLANNESELEYSDYEVFTSEEPKWSFIAKPADDSSLCFAVTACGRFVLPVILCACCNQHVFDDEVSFYDHLGSQQLCNACASGG